MALESWKDADGNWNWPKAYVGETKDYGIDLSTRMTDEGDTISSVTWTLPTGLTSADTDNNLTTKIMKVWIQADTAGDYEVDCEVATTDGADTQTYIFRTKIEVVA